MAHDATQQATQDVVDPRRLGHQTSSLCAEDVADIMCILHPASPAAFRVVACTARNAPQHVLQSRDIESFGIEEKTGSDGGQNTFVYNSDPAQNAQDLALRLSSRPVQPALGFTFGRNSASCDIVIGADSNKRVSNVHFRIFVNNHGVLMLHDMSTNGTLVDDKLLKGKSAPDQASRMLVVGSMIRIASPDPDQIIKFIVRIPQRLAHGESYMRQLNAHLRRMVDAERQLGADLAKRDALEPGFKRISLSTLPTPENPFGMHWDGGEEYNVVGLLGKGAFATVYKLATKLDGQYFAAKELEKRKFVKNGRLDQRLDNEMQIMRSIRHKNIVQYIHYQDHAEHLYIIMEFVPCGDLLGYLSHNKVLSEPLAKLMSRQVLEALHYLHSKQITHRDIKPDNILIADQDPFTVKLSDFGLSKVVSTNETFLKTFCGTLLYCAPEVFPHYEEHIARKGIKRRRSGGVGQRFHSYSQSVDIWSYAAVLWLSMCNSPPFEGVVDHTGRGMFNKIMETHLDTEPLLARGISVEALDLLTKMLNTDPSMRPTETECLQHAWLYDGREALAKRVSHVLKVIAEEEGAADELEVDGQAESLSRLTVNDRAPTTHGAERNLSNVAGAEDEHDYEYWDGAQEFDSGDLDFFDPRQSKRVKSNLPRKQVGHVLDRAAALPSSPDSQGLDVSELPHGQRSAPKHNRVFGEIGDSALESSGALDAHARAALAIQNQGDANDSGSLPMSFAASDMSYEAHETSVLHRSDSVHLQQSDLPGYGSMGLRAQMIEANEAGVRGSADGSDSANEPQEPQTPNEHPSGHVQDAKLPSQNGQQRRGLLHADLPQFSKVLTHEPPGTEQTVLATKLSPEMPPMPPGREPIPALAQRPLLSVPEPVLGVLCSTPDSFRAFTLEITQRVTMWGRHGSNDFVYPDPNDVRIPKRALAMYFHVKNIEREEKAGRDWRIMPGLHTVISTLARAGIWVNGVHFVEKHSDGTQLYGRLYSGDIITVYKNTAVQPPEHLSFVCNFFYGEAATRRPEDLPFRPLKAIEPSQPRNSF